MLLGFKNVGEMMLKMMIASSSAPIGPSNGLCSMRCVIDRRGDRTAATAEVGVVVMVAFTARGNECGRSVGGGLLVGKIDESPQNERSAHGESGTGDFRWCCEVVGCCCELTHHLV